VKQKFTVFGLVLLFVSNLANAQVAAFPANKPGPINPKLFIDPSSATLFLGKASLIVDPLTHKGQFYVGDYQLKVLPYFLKSENGKLELEASDDAVRKLLGGVAVKFIGKAANNKSGKPKVIIGKATPSSKDRGRVTFSIVTENGTMVFDTSYHFGE
jgi:hypothetical protein